MKVCILQSSNKVFWFWLNFYFLAPVTVLKVVSTGMAFLEQVLNIATFIQIWRYDWSLQFCTQCAVVKLKPEKTQAWTRFKPMTSVIPVQCSTNWAIKPSAGVSLWVGQQANWPTAVMMILPAWPSRGKFSCKEAQFQKGFSCQWKPVAPLLKILMKLLHLGVGHFLRTLISQLLELFA